MRPGYQPKTKVKMDQEVATTSRRTLLQDRYGNDAVPAVGPWNATLDLLLAHRSVRSYLARPLPEGTLETIVAAAQSASTSSNLQTWSVVAVTNPDAKRKLATVAANQQHVIECPLFLVWLADISRNQRLGDAAGVTMEVMPYPRHSSSPSSMLASRRKTLSSPRNSSGCLRFTLVLCGTTRRLSLLFSACRRQCSVSSACVSAMRSPEAWQK